MKQSVFIRDGSGCEFELVIHDSEGQTGLIQLTDEDLINLHISTAQMAPAALRRAKNK